MEATDEAYPDLFVGQVVEFALSAGPLFVAPGPPSGHVSHLHYAGSTPLGDPYFVSGVVSGLPLANDYAAGLACIWGEGGNAVVDAGIRLFAHVLEHDKPSLVRGTLSKLASTTLDHGHPVRPRIGDPVNGESSLYIHTREFEDNPPVVYTWSIEHIQTLLPEKDGEEPINPESTEQVSMDCRIHARLLDVTPKTGRTDHALVLLKGWQAQAAQLRAISEVACVSIGEAKDLARAAPVRLLQGLNQREYAAADLLLRGAGVKVAHEYAPRRNLAGSFHLIPAEQGIACTRSLETSRAWATKADAVQAAVGVGIK
jgi:hypothetical protein